MTAFTDYFWGEKNNGFDVLYHNMKNGQDSSREFAEFLRESCTVEESYVKLQVKLAKFASNCGTKGSFGPYWQVLKALAEKLSLLHQQLLTSWQELLKDVQKYNTDQQKKHREVKDHESSTMDSVQGIQQTLAALHKAKEKYHACSLEYEKLKRENASPKELERAEIKFKRANDEYRLFVEKYATVRTEFEAKMTDACKRFQELEETHLKQMRDFVDSYATAWEKHYDQLGEAQQEFQTSSNELTVDKLLDTLIQSKTTGTEKPGPIEFEDADLSTLPQQASTPDAEKKDFVGQDRSKKEGGVQRFPMLLDTANHVSDFLQGKRKKKKKSRKDSKDKIEAEAVDKNSLQLDEEGYQIRPSNPMGNDRDSWYSSSESESDQEDKKKGFKVEIKPFSPNDNLASANNVDDIRTLVMNLHISPTGSRATPVNDGTLRGSSSVTNVSKPSQDVFDQDIFNDSFSNPVQNTGVSSRYHSPALDNTSTTNSHTSTTPGRDDLSLSSPDDFVLARRLMSTPTGTNVLPGMSHVHVSRNSVPLSTLVRSSGRQQTSDSFRINDRTDSMQSLNNMPFSSSSMSFGSSRGPSPLSLAMSDAIPLAVAFSESVNAYFKGDEESKCKVKLTGDMVMSFPAGIISFLLENPSVAVLSCRIKNTTKLEQILVNKQLLSEVTSQCTSDCRVYAFDMIALAQHLRQQSEINRSASYFNIDILKYQVRPSPGFQSAPLRLVSYWKCEPSKTDFRLDYFYNAAALSSPMPLTNISIHVPINGDVTKMQCIPPGTWSSEKVRAIWQLSSISELSEKGSQGCVRAKFELNCGPSTPSVAAVQFVCDGTTLSGVDFELAGPGYRVSLVKKRIITGKYLTEADDDLKQV